METTTYTAIIVLLVLLALEGIAEYRENHHKPFLKDAASNIAIGAGYLLFNGLNVGIAIEAYDFMYRFRFMEPGHAWWVWGILVVLNDLISYWYHVAAHRINWFWATHSVHHSSQEFNFSITFRNSWVGNLNGRFLFWIWLPLLGFEPTMILIVYQAGLVYQAWLHTKRIGKLPRFFEYIMNTPSHHPVHHGSNTEYLDKNMGGVFIIWDRMFGTFAEEKAPVVYGLTKPVKTANPLRLVLDEYRKLFKTVFLSGSIRKGIRYALGSPQ
jgi:sterol desaturase/sphingolipid hydroxylase (fatty acid hydroxylase superfamily)